MTEMLAKAKRLALMKKMPRMKPKAKRLKATTLKATTLKKKTGVAAAEIAVSVPSVEIAPRVMNDPNVEIALNEKNVPAAWSFSPRSEKSFSRL
jgi:hypothetical protein